MRENRTYSSYGEGLETDRGRRSAPRQPLTRQLLFKDWKSYANLHALQTEHPAIVEGFIWASLCAAFLKRSLAHWAQLVSEGRAISTRIAAQAGAQILPLLALFAARGFRVTRLSEILRFLVNNAVRTHPERHKRGHAHALGLRDLLIA